MKTTIRDVAKACNVSIGTVSGVLNNKISVKEETRNKIYRTIHQLNYFPLRKASLPKQIETKTIGLVLPFMNLTSGSFFSRFIQAAKKACSLRGYDCLLYTEDDILNKIHRGRANIRHDGIIVFCPYGPYEEYLKVLSGWNVPSVIIRRKVSIPGVLMINNDEYGGAWSALEHLHSLGHDRIGFIIRKTVQSPYLQFSRDKAYHDFMKEKGLPDKKKWTNTIVIGDDYAAWLRDLFSQDDTPTAFFCYDDDMAAATIRDLAKIGKKVPDDVSTVSYNNDNFAIRTNPRLTSVNVAVEKMTELACQAVFDNLLGDGNITGMCIDVKDELIIRESSGKPPLTD